MLLACHKPLTSEPVADESESKEPIKVFNLRTKCAKLGDQILQLRPVYPGMTPSQTSHFDVKTNLCYVDIFVASGYVRNNDWGNVIVERLIRTGKLILQGAVRKISLLHSRKTMETVMPGIMSEGQ